MNRGNDNPTCIFLSDSIHDFAFGLSDAQDDIGGRDAGFVASATERATMIAFDIIDGNHDRAQEELERFVAFIGERLTESQRKESSQ